MYYFKKTLSSVLVAALLVSGYGATGVYAVDAIKEISVRENASLESIKSDVLIEEKISEDEAATDDPVTVAKSNRVASGGNNVVPDRSNEPFLENIQYNYSGNKDTTAPTVSLTSTNNVATSQTVILTLQDNVGVVAYYWGTNSSPSYSEFTSITSATSKNITKTVSSEGKYYLVARDAAGNKSTILQTTFRRITLNANGGSVSPAYVVVKSGSTVSLPSATRSGYSFKGWDTSSTSTSGVTSITASANKTYYAVWQKSKTLKSIDIITNPSKSVYYIGDSLNTSGLKLKLTYIDGSTETVTSGFSTSGFSSSSSGTKTVTVTYSGFRDSFNVTVNTPSMTLSKSNITLNKGSTTTISATTTPFGQAVSWTSSNSDVVTVSTGGTVSAMAPGTAILTARFTYNGTTYTKTCSVTVSSGKTLKGMSISAIPSKTTYYIGDSLSTTGIKLKLTYSDGSTETVTSGFSTSGYSTSTAGTKTVTVSYEGYIDTYTISVYTPELSLSDLSVSMKVDDRYTVTATTTPPVQTVSWSSSDTSVVSVTYGVLNAKKKGSANITATFTYNGITYKNVCKVTVTDKTVSSSAAFVVENVSARAGGTFDVKINTKNNPGIVSIKLLVNYDPSILTLVSAESRDFSGVSFSPVNNRPFVVNWVDAISPNNSTNGTVVVLTFKVKDNAVSGTSTSITVDYNSDDVYDSAYNNVYFGKQNGTVSITNRLSGDVNGDGNVNNKDLGLLQQYLNYWSVTIDELAADVNGDGKLNNKDYGLLQQYLNNWDVTLK